LVVSDTILGALGCNVYFKETNTNSFIQALAHTAPSSSKGPSKGGPSPSNGS
jgi:hypothetical protein